MFHTIECTCTRPLFFHFYFVHCRIHDPVIGIALHDIACFGNRFHGDLVDSNRILGDVRSSDGILWYLIASTFELMALMCY